MAAHLAFIAGALETAASEAERAMDLLSQTGGADRTLQGLVAVERGDRAALRAAAGAQRVGLLQGAGIDAMAGALRALDEDAAGLAAMDAAADFLDQAGVQFSAALVRRARAIVVPGDAGACRAAQAAVATFDRLGARTMRRELESLLPGAARDDASRDEATRDEAAAGEDQDVPLPH